MNCDFDDDTDDKYQEAKAIVLGCYVLIWAVVIIIVSVILITLYAIK